MCSENRPFYLLPTEGVELLDFPITFRRSFRSPAATTFAGRGEHQPSSQRRNKMKTVIRTALTG